MLALQLYFSLYHKRLLKMIYSALVGIFLSMKKNYSGARTAQADIIAYFER
nr:MAG TPA: hypothetical protein [Bacteriophage sp.]